MIPGTLCIKVIIKFGVEPNLHQAILLNVGESLSLRDDEDGIQFLCSVTNRQGRSVSMCVCVQHVVVNNNRPA